MTQRKIALVSRAAVAATSPFSDVPASCSRYGSQGHVRRRADDVRVVVSVGNSGAERRRQSRQQRDVPEQYELPVLPMVGTDVLVADVAVSGAVRR